MRTCDLIVIGGGAAGINAARGPASKGWDVVMIEEAFMGGTCTNIGCMPSKSLLTSAHHLKHFMNSETYGISAESIHFDWDQILKNKDDLVMSLRQGAEGFVSVFPSVSILQGRAGFIAPHTIEVNGTQLQSDRIVIANGARSNIPPISGLEGTPYLTSTTAMELRKLPSSMAIMGGGIIAAEFAQLFQSFGVKVTIFEMNDHLVSNLDSDIRSYTLDMLKNEGVSVFTGTAIQRVAYDHNHFILSTKSKQTSNEFHSESLLVATGRKPNSDLLNLEITGIQTDERGFIIVDSNYSTNVSGVWAIGDVIGGAMLTHKAREDGNMLARHLVDGYIPNYSSSSSIPGVIFTDPEIAYCGLTEEQARNKYKKIEVKLFPFGHIGRARATQSDFGFIKLIVDYATSKILGAHIVGSRAGEIIHEIVAIMRYHGTYSDIQNMIHIHPTYSEGLLSVSTLFDKSE